MSENLAEVIKEAKKAQHVTAEKLAAVADTSVSSINKFLAGETRSPSAYAVGRMCAYLHISLDEYFGIDVPNTHVLENEALRAKSEAEAESHAKMESVWKSAIARKDKIIHWLTAAVVLLAVLAVGSYLIWDFTHTEWGFYRG